MRKILLLIFFVFLPVFLLTPVFLASSQARAEVVCKPGISGIDFKYNFTPPLINSEPSITVTIEHSVLPEGNARYRLGISEKSNVSNNRGRGYNWYDNVESVDGKIVFSNVTTSDGEFGVGTARVEFRTYPDNEKLCHEEFTVIKPDNPDGSACSLDFTLSDLKPNSNLRFRANNLQGADGNKRGIELFRADRDGTSLNSVNGTNTCKTNKQLRRDTGVSFGQQIGGFYTVHVNERCFGNPLGDSRDNNSNYICGSPILIEVDRDGGRVIGPVSDTNLSKNAPLSRPCSNADNDSKTGCKRIKTAFGNVSTDAAGFTRWILGFVLGISGGIVIIIIIVSGYRFMTSQGDPEKVKNARDQLTAAIVGLLFIIFSLVILELITRDILGLPGFGS